MEICELQCELWMCTIYKTCSREPDSGIFQICPDHNFYMILNLYETILFKKLVVQPDSSILQMCPDHNPSIFTWYWFHFLTILVYLFRLTCSADLVYLFWFLFCSGFFLVYLFWFSPNISPVSLGNSSLGTAEFNHAPVSMDAKVTPKRAQHTRLKILVSSIVFKCTMREDRHQEKKGHRTIVVLSFKSIQSLSLWWCNEMNVWYDSSSLLNQQMAKGGTRLCINLQIFMTFDQVNLLLLVF